MNLSKNFLIKCAGCLLAVAALAITTSCAWMEGDLLDLSGGEPADITIDQLCQRMSAATDPEGVYAKAKSYRLIQEVESVDGNSKNRDYYSTVVLFKQPDFIKQVSLRNGIPFSMILFRDGSAWNIDPRTKKSQKLPEGTGLNLIKTFSDMLKPGNNYKTIFQDVQIDVSYSEGRKYYRLICRVADPAIAPYVFYIDAETYLTRKLETILYSNDGAGSRSLYVAISEDYEWISGVKMPRRSRITVNGKTDISKLISFTLNPDLPDSEFSVTQPWNYDK